MTYTEQLRLTQDWQKVKYLSAQEEQGEFGIYYRVFVEHEGQRKHFNASPNLMSITRCGYIKHDGHCVAPCETPMLNLPPETLIELRRGDDQYAEIEWNIIQ